MSALGGHFHLSPRWIIAAVVVLWLVAERC